MSKSSIIVITYPGCIFFEIALATEILSKKYNIIIAHPTTDNFKSSNGLTITPDLDFKSIELDNCKAILVPGGDPAPIKENTDVDNILGAANDKNILIGAICAGPFLLAKAGILKGKSIAHGYQEKQLNFLKEYFKDVNITDDDFICDKNIITAKPEMHIDFAIEIACRLKAIDPSRSGRLKQYYKGIQERTIRTSAIALINNGQNKFLFQKDYDEVKKETFYRPLGGGIDFSETSEQCLKREFKEEIGQDINIIKKLETFENIFTLEGIKGHQLMLLYEAEFINKDLYAKEDFDIIESGVSIGKAYWRSVEEIKKEEAKLYPLGIEDIINENLIQTHKVVTLESDRCILRPLVESDAKSIYQYAKNPNVSKYTLWEPHRSIEDAKSYINSYASNYYKKGELEPLGIELKSKPGKVIGTVGCLWIRKKHNTMELLYGIDEAYWGKGITSEVSKVVIDYCFKVLKPKRIQAHCKAPNIASARVMEKIGMTYEGTKKASLFHREQYWDMKIYSILSGDLNE